MHPNQKIIASNRKINNSLLHLLFGSTVRKGNPLFSNHLIVFLFRHDFLVLIRNDIKNIMFHVICWFSPQFSLWMFYITYRKIRPIPWLLTPCKNSSKKAVHHRPFFYRKNASLTQGIFSTLFHVRHNPFMCPLSIGTDFAIPRIPFVFNCIEIV